MITRTDEVERAVLRVIWSGDGITRSGLWSVVPVRAACVAIDRHDAKRQLDGALRRLRIAGLIRYCRSAGWRRA